MGHYGPQYITMMGWSKLTKNKPHVILTYFFLFYFPFFLYFLSWILYSTLFDPQDSSFSLPLLFFTYPFFFVFDFIFSTFMLNSSKLFSLLHVKELNRRKTHFFLFCYFSKIQLTETIFFLFCYILRKQINTIYICLKNIRNCGVYHFY